MRGRERGREYDQACHPVEGSHGADRRGGPGEAGRQARGCCGCGGRRRAAWGGAQHAGALPCPPAFAVSGRSALLDCRPLPLSSRVPRCCAPTRGGVPAGSGRGVVWLVMARGGLSGSSAVQFRNAPPGKGAGRGPCCGSRQRVGRIASSAKRWPTAAPGGRRRSGGRRDGARGPPGRQSSWPPVPDASAADWRALRVAASGQSWPEPVVERVGRGVDAHVRS